MNIVIRTDASSIKDSSCQLRYFLTTYKGFQGLKIDSNLIFGSSFHKVVETYDLTRGDKALSIAEGLKYWEENFIPGKTWVKDTAKHLNDGFLFMAANKYFAAHENKDIFRDCKVLEYAGEAMVEKKFSILIYEEGDVKVYLQGTIDKIVEMLKSGAIVIADWKTSGAFKHDEYFEAYKMSPQLLVYALAIRKLSLMYPKSNLSKIFSNRNTIKAFIYGAFHSPTGIEFKRSPIFPYTETDLILFEKNLIEEIKILVKNVKWYEGTKEYPYPQGLINGACQTQFGLCKFFGACSKVNGVTTPDKNALFDSLLRTNYPVREYRPLNFGGGLEKKISPTTVVGEEQ